MNKLTRRTFGSLIASFATTPLIGCGGGGGGGTSGTQTSGQAIANAAVGASTSNASNSSASAAVKVGYAGIGVPSITYWDKSYAFADLARHGEVRDLSGNHTTTNTDGTASSDFIYVLSATPLGAGAYAISFSGSATINVNGSVTGTITNQIYDATTNRTTATWTLPSATTGTTYLIFTNTKRASQSATNTGITGLQIWRPSYPTDGSVIYTREFVTAMSKFQTIRGMDFFGTNANPSVNWADRTLPSHLGWTGALGQSWEMFVILANAANCNIWLNIPANATNDYVNNLANLIKYGSDGVNPYTSVQAHPVYPPLNSNLYVYTEYGNEVWNSAGGFYCYSWALTAASNYISTTTHPINFDGLVMGDQYMALRRWVAFRSASISLIFKNVFSTSSDRVRGILAAQSGNGNAFFSVGLQWAESFFSQARTGNMWDTLLGSPRALAVKDIWYGGGGAVYYDSTSPPNASAYQAYADRTAYFNGLPTTQSSSFAQAIIADAVWARGYGLKLVAYEGGPEPGGTATGSGSGSALAPYFNNDSRMATAMEAIHSLWSTCGGDELNYYMYSSSPSWSFINDLQQNTVSDTNTVKLGAIDTITTTVPSPVAINVSGPRSFPLKSTSAVVGNDNATYALNGTVYRMRSSTTNYVLLPVTMQGSGTYGIALNVPLTSAAGVVSIWLNGVLIGSVSVPTNSSNVGALTQTVSGVFTSGLNVIRISAVSGDIYVSDIVVS